MSLYAAIYCGLCVVAAIINHANTTPLQLAQNRGHWIAVQVGEMRLRLQFPTLLLIGKPFCLRWLTGQNNSFYLLVRFSHHWTRKNRTGLKSKELPGFA